MPSGNIMSVCIQTFTNYFSSYLHKILEHKNLYRCIYWKHYCCDIADTCYFCMCEVSTNSYFNGCAGRSRNTWEFHKLNNNLRQSGRMLLTWIDAFHIHESSFSHFYLNMTLCRWLLCHLVLCCICSGNDFITYFSISLWIPWIHSWIHCFKSSVLARHVSYALLLP